MGEAVPDSTTFIEKMRGSEAEMLNGRPTGRLENIGGTPLVSLPRPASEPPSGVELYAKAEHLNPGGPVKDRPALSIILDGERTGALTPATTILDPTSATPAP